MRDNDFIEQAADSPVAQPAARPLTMEEKLGLFDPSLHGGEVIAYAPVGTQHHQRKQKIDA